MEPVIATRRVPLASPQARWLIAAAVLGSGIALLDGTVVNVALPAIGREFGAGLTDQQWMLPLAARMPAGAGQPLGHSFAVAMMITAAVSAAGGIAAALTIRTGADVTHHVLPGVNHACQDVSTRQAAPREAA